ncbi:MAG: putative glycoside hydrolase [Selenomonadaceae bacterium]|nr:putative glycoside hydrolase [Selenomonadaceae bacterium]
MGNEVYRPKSRPGRRLRRILTAVVLAAAVAVIALFFICQKYLVFTADGVRIDPRAASAAASATSAPAPEVSPLVVDVEVEIGKTDYSTLVTDAGTGLSALHGKYLTADQITPENLKSAAAQIKAAGGDLLVLQMKPSSGRLSWKSAVALADEAGANGSAELQDTIRELKEDGVRFAATVSCCADSALAQAKSELALKSAGMPYSDGSGSWVDPMNETVQQYVAALCKELAGMGFEEIFCSYMQTPATTADLELGEDVSRSDAVMGFAKNLRRSVRSANAKLSIVCSVDSVAYDRANLTGQELTLLPRVFDRLCVFTDAATLALLEGKMTDAYPELDTETRVVPFIPAKRDAGSWILTT